jgi:hypothetical protein
MGGRFARERSFLGMMQTGDFNCSRDGKNDGFWTICVKPNKTICKSFSRATMVAQQSKEPERMSDNAA